MTSCRRYDSMLRRVSSYGGHSEAGWSWLLALYADQERFAKSDATTADIIHFYVTDTENSGSIRSSIRWARENARALRPFIPLEMWVQLNAFHGEVEQMGLTDIAASSLPRTCARVRAGCLAQIGVADSTLYRDEGYLFFRLGLLIERADQTSRLLDVKFAQAGQGPRRCVNRVGVWWRRSCARGREADAVREQEAVA